MTKIEKLLKDIEENFYTIESAAKELNILEQTLRNAISQESVKSVKVLNTTAITKSELKKQIELRRKK